METGRLRQNSAAGAIEAWASATALQPRAVPRITSAIDMKRPDTGGNPVRQPEKRADLNRRGMQERQFVPNHQHIFFLLDPSIYF